MSVVTLPFDYLDTPFHSDLDNGMIVCMNDATLSFTLIWLKKQPTLTLPCASFRGEGEKDVLQL